MERAFLEFDAAAARVGVDRPGAPSGASERRGGRGQDPASRSCEADRGRPRAAVPGGEAPARARPRARVHRPAGAGRRVRPLDPARARLRARGAERGCLLPQLRANARRRRPGGDPAVLDRPRPDARVPSRQEDLGARPSEHATGRAPRCRLSDGGRVDDHGLPPRLLPLGSPSGEHLHPRLRRARPRGLRAGGEAHRRGHGEAHPALRRCRDREHRRDSPPYARARRALRPRARAGVPGGAARALRPLLRRRGSPTSTRCR